VLSCSLQGAIALMYALPHTRYFRGLVALQQPKCLNVQFDDVNLLKTALTHSSFLPSQLTWPVHRVSSDNPISITRMRQRVGLPWIPPAENSKPKAKLNTKGLGAYPHSAPPAVLHVRLCR
jgi:hypothetical protein